MKNQQTFGLILGTTCLATIAMTQVSRPGDAAAQDRQTPVAGQGNADSLLKVQQRLQQAVTSEMRAGAMKHDVSIDERAVMISLFGERGLVAGAPVSQMTGLDGQRKPNDPNSTTGSGGDQGKRAAGTTTDNQDVLGVIFLSRELAPSANSGQGATGRTPGASGGQSGTTGTTGGQSGSSGTQDPQNRDAAGQGTTTQDSTGSNQLMGFEVRRSQRGQGVELVDESGQVAMQVELLGGVNMSGTREASAPREGREGREDESVGGGDPLGDPRLQDPQGKDPQGKDRPRTVAPTPSDVTGAGAGSAEWSVVYASVVNQLCAQHHGKK